jgi:hypothetical protein
MANPHFNVGAGESARAFLPAFDFSLLQTGHL